jgi:uroporphyrin-III C-methyltransferase
MSLMSFQDSAQPPKGFVRFVGAGPGAEDLITVRGMRALAEAEVVVYDELANRALLRHCRPGVELLHVGKRAGCHSARQEEINWLLVAHAHAGRQVLRLKGGDPTVFGRLGEELHALRVAGIEFEIVPGVTAACASAAAAGISLTERGAASAAIFATGHECADKSSPGLDWAALAGLEATLCVYMGTRTLGSLAHRLIREGKAPDTPLIIVSRASLPSQVIRSGTLETAAELAAEADGAPSLIVIGEMAASNPELLAVHNDLTTAHAT